MGANFSVLLISCDGEEVPVSADVLSAASVVWRERLQLVGSLSPQPRAEEDCTRAAIMSFVEIISMLTQDAQQDKPLLGEVPIDKMLMSLGLIHKYDCPVALKLLEEHLEKGAFYHPSTGIYQSAGAAYVNSWVTQAHVDYIVKKQELFGPESLTLEMKKLLVGLIYHEYLYLQSGRGRCYVHKELSESIKNDESEHAPKEPNFIVPVWKFSAPTQRALLPLVKPAF